MVHHHFALVETWREVSKVLPANSLILKIWMAWAEEAQNVSFSVKRIRNPKPLILKKPEETKEESSEYNRKSHQRVRRRNSRNSVDTFHPRALAKLSKNISDDIQDQMKKIISQGEVIRKHLTHLKVNNTDIRLWFPHRFLFSGP